MRLYRWGLVAGLGVLALLLLGATAAETGSLSADGWAALKSLGWPGALVGAAFSPLGKAGASLLQALIPGQSAPGGAYNSRVIEALEHQAEVLRDLVDLVKRQAEISSHQNEINSRTVEALQQIQIGLARLLERTARAGGMAG